MAKDVLLSTLPEWNVNLRDKLKNKWITTAEQVIAICATEKGIKLIAEYLDISIEEMKALLEKTRKHISSEKLKELDSPVNTSKYGLGAQKPRKD